MLVKAADAELAPAGQAASTRLAGRSRPTSFPWRLLALIMIIGAVFRFMALGEVRHGFDEGYPAYDALRILEGHELLLSGQPSSVFLDNPPLMAYLQLIPLLLWRSIWSVYLFVTALNTLAIGVVFLTTRRLLGETAAFVAAFLFAISPWVVHFSRMPWVQGLLPLLLALLAWGLWPALVTKQRAERPLFVAMLALTVLVLSYILGIAIVGPVAALIALYWRHLPKRPILAGALLLGAGLLIFGAGLIQKGNRNSERLESFVSNNEFSINTIAVDHALRLVTGLDYESQAGLEERSPRPALSRVASGLLLVLVLAGMGRALLALREDDEKRRLAIVLLTWFWAPVVGFLFLPYLVHPHYLLLTLPAGHLLAAWGIAPLFDRPRWRPALSGALLVMAGLFGLNIYAAGQAVAANPSAPDFNGWALADAARIGSAIRELTAGEGPPRRIVAEDNAAMLSSLSATYVDTMPELQYPRFLLLPGQEPLLYLLRNIEPGPLGLGAHEEWFPDQSIRASDGDTVSFLRIQPFDRQEALNLPQTVIDWTSDAGLTLLGYTILTPPPYEAEGSIMVKTYWRVEDLHPDRGEWFVTPFIQIADADWQLLSNVAAEGQWGYRWQIGDLYVQQQTITLPDYVQPGEHRFLIGLSNAIDGQNFSLNAPTGPEPFWQMSITVAE
ncbi:MAG: glycosyltransferase family 39 protein [Ardenticatenales bacterium]|nr:glycosyltransferase family 39 protein [Ardenticatenales bacterium]